MTKFFMKWWVDRAKIPDTPQENVKLRLKMLEAVKAELSAGMFTEWGHLSDGMEGYAITEASEEDLSATMLKYTPVIAYTLVPVLNADQSMEAAKKAAAAMQA
jgi:hypothetical protein